MAAFGRALELARDTGDRTAELGARTGRGDVYRLQGRYEQAAAAYYAAQERIQDIDNRNWRFEAR